MIQWLIYAMIAAGSALMVCNIYCFIRFARYIKGMRAWGSGNRILYFPIFLLVCFLLGYIAIGLFGHPDIIMAGVLFGGSIFVYVMYRLLNGIIGKVVESEHLEAELMAAEESNREKVSFLSGISHEMRTPINVILGMDAIALKSPYLPAQTRDQLEKIGRSGRKLLRLISNLLDLQEFESSELTMRSEPFLLRELLEQTEQIAEDACAEKGLTWETAYGECAGREYLGDAAYLKRVLINILDNAVKFTDVPGRVRFEVSSVDSKDGKGGDERGADSCSEYTAAGTDSTGGTVSMDSGGDLCTLQFIISDTGAGIDEEFLPKIFEPFSREDESATNRFGGSGLGLPAANRIVTQMGGKIGVLSRKNEGSAFTVTIPLPIVPQVESEESRDFDESFDAEQILKDRRVLIVEDIPENAEIVADLLEIEGVECEHALDGQIALDMVARSGEWEYDAILMDLRMPVMDGLEATRRIRALDREDTRKIPILALTANAYESDVQAVFQAGMNAHLVKPVDADLLYRELGKWIRKTEERG